eukprot:TRINITY_DN3131_c0_g1_i1.p1 TRINITY_DN3131_c0_g1~~TRINITY_DN3131_c0_g1_i1.p1  ORF type:complete len:465 (+),score=211.72 TRINITY_DN3131_c0_g1_i1:51-1445(+)
MRGAMRAALLLAAVGACAVVADTRKGGAPTTDEELKGAPWVKDTERKAVYELTSQEFAKYVKKVVPAERREYHMMVLLQWEEDKWSHKCNDNDCAWLRKQFYQFAEHYHKELTSVNEQPYVGDGTPLYFAVVSLHSQQGHDALTKYLQTHANGMSLLKRGAAAGMNHHQVFRLREAATLSAAQRDEQKARKEAGGEWKYLKRADSRAARRARSLSTQEELEEKDIKWDGYLWGRQGMRIICAWLRTEINHEVWECPQDVAQDAVDAEKKAGVGKQIILTGVVVSAVGYLVRTFHLILPGVQPNADDLLRSRAAASAVLLNDEHATRRAAVDRFWQALTNAGALLATVGVSCAASGMYWTYLVIGSPWGGGIPYPYSKVTGWEGEIPHTTIGIAWCITLTSAMFVSLGRLSSLDHAVPKYCAVWALMIGLASTGAFTLNTFINQRNMLQGTWLWDHVIDKVRDHG